MTAFLQQLRVDWPEVSEKASTEALRNRAIAELSPAGYAGALPPGTLGRVCLKELMEERGRTAGYDPNVDSCLVTEDLLSLLAELQEAVQAGAVGSSLGLAAAPDAGADSYVVLHVVSCEEEFQQQKLDLLWWKLDHQAPLSQAPAHPGVQGVITEAWQGPGTRCSLDGYLQGSLCGNR